MQGFRPNLIMYKFKIIKNVKKLRGCVNWNEYFKLYPGIMAIVALDENGERVGQVAITSDGWIVLLAVKPELRGNGLGSDLLAKAEKTMSKQGWEKATLHPQREFEDRLIPWYESKGYELTGYDEKIGEFIMQKNLQRSEES